ncbi:universal stress protein [Oricola sp.]|uniref:universal stress protein n=1 Tax=Oricola sp. TaxID=1979950 RepID=UPI003BAB12C2
MFPKTLMTVIGSEQDAASLNRAIELCGSTECHLAVTVIGIALAASSAAYGAIPADAWAQEREEGKQAANKQQEVVEAMLSQSGVSGDVCSYYCDEGQVAAVVGARARYADLGLVYKSSDIDRRVANRSSEGFIYHSSKPFLVIPQGVAPKLAPKKAVVAWNATKEAARAVHLSLDMLKVAEEVRIVMIDPTAGEFDQGEEPGADVAAYLARHGANVAVDAIPSSGRSISQALLRHANDVAAEMIVAGAYGHSRLREFLFGGTTRELLANEEIAVLMAH